MWSHLKAGHKRRGMHSQAHRLYIEENTDWIKWLNSIKANRPKLYALMKSNMSTESATMIEVWVQSSAESTDILIRAAHTLDD
jgi:hypothetical protein